MNHNFAHRTGLAAAAATALFAGTTQTFAGETGGNTQPRPGQQPTQQPNVNQKKSPQAEVVFKQMKKELAAMSKRLIKGLHTQADAGTQAMDDLAGGEPSDEDLQALVDSIDGSMTDALSGASEAFDGKAGKMLKKMQRKKASVGQMRKASALVERLSDSIDAAHAELMTGLGAHFTETFPDADVSFDSGDDEDDTDGDDIDDGGDQPPPNGQQPPPDGRGGVPNAWPPNPPLEWPSSVAYPPSGAPGDYRTTPPAGWPSTEQWPPAPWRDGATMPPQGQPAPNTGG